MIRDHTLSFVTALLLAGPLAPIGIAAQDADPRAGDRGLRLMVGDVGVAIGHVPRVTGLRVNWSDRHLDSVTGLNLTLWRADPDGVGGRVRGLSAGLAPQAGRLEGLGLGLGVVVGEESLSGIHAGGLAAIGGDAVQGLQGAGVAAISGGDILGLQVGGLGAVVGGTSRGLQLSLGGSIAGEGIVGGQLAGLGAVAGGEARGLQVGGLAAIAGGPVQGVQLGGLATIGDGSLKGIQAAGLAVIGSTGLQGVQVGGLATVSGGDARGLQASGLAGVAAGRMVGVQVGGAALVAGCSMRGIQLSLGSVEGGRGDDRFELPDEPCEFRGVAGVTAGGYRVVGPAARGVTAGGWIEVDELRGVSAAALQRSGLQVGLSVALVNWTDHLRGVQLGLVNRAANNPSPFRILPLMNLSF